MYKIIEYAVNSKQGINFENADLYFTKFTENDMRQAMRYSHDNLRYHGRIGPDDHFTILGDRGARLYTMLYMIADKLVQAGYIIIDEHGDILLSQRPANAIRQLHPQEEYLLALIKESMGI